MAELSAVARQDEKRIEAAQSLDNLQRRRYAEAALTGILSQEDAAQEPCDLIASCAFKFADAMLAEQKRRESAESAS